MIAVSTWMIYIINLYINNSISVKFEWYGSENLSKLMNIYITDLIVIIKYASITEICLSFLLLREFFSLNF